MSIVRDHFPVEVHVQLPQPWKLLPKPSATRRWNQHALQIGLEDPYVAQHFARDVQAVWSPLAESFPNMGTREELDQFWQLLNQQVSEPAS